MLDTIVKTTVYVMAHNPDVVLGTYLDLPLNLFQVQYHDLFEFEPPRRSVIPFMSHHRHHGRSLQVTN